MADHEKDPLARLAGLADSVDETFASIQTRQGACMQCRAGCTDCCRARLTITHVEAAFFRRGLARLPEAERKDLAQRTRDKTRDMCPALDPEGRCQLYDSRPLICRSFGVPLRRRREVVLVNPIVIDACDLNFVDVPLETLPAEDVLDQTSLDTELAAINAEFCARHDLPTDERIGIAQILASLD
ncbi:MAG: YkgJ family cysteine cluster protein [Acidobacteria bacterium]|nr:MAG: YkgJ family cysteine cluster protein [Acidobacteriota bacterium]